MTSPTLITVMASGAMKEAFVELAPLFERASGHKVIATWLGGVEIARRVAAGEFTDMVFQAAAAIDGLIAFFKSPAAHAILRNKGMAPA